MLEAIYLKHSAWKQAHVLPRDNAIIRVNSNEIEIVDDCL